MKIWTCGSSLRRGAWNAWMRIENVSGASRLSNFWISFGTVQMISCRNWWPWTKPGYITLTRRQSNNQWNSGIVAHPTPKNSKCKNPLEISHLDFLGSRQHPPYWLSSKGPNYQHGVLFISAGAIERHFERKAPTPQEGNQGRLVLAWQCPAALGTSNPEETGLPVLPVSWSLILFSGCVPVGLPPVLWTEQ